MKSVKDAPPKFRQGDIVAEKGYRGEYLVVWYNKHRDEISIVKDHHVCTLGGYRAYLVRRAEYHDVPKPDDASKPHWDGRPAYCCHQSYNDD